MRRVRGSGTRPEREAQSIVHELAARLHSAGAPHSTPGCLKLLQQRGAHRPPTWPRRSARTFISTSTPILACFERHPFTAAGPLGESPHKNRKRPAQGCARSRVADADAMRKHRHHRTTGKKWPGTAAGTRKVGCRECVGRMCPCRCAAVRVAWARSAHTRRVRCVLAPIPYSWQDLPAALSAHPELIKETPGCE